MDAYELPLDLDWEVNMDDDWNIERGRAEERINTQNILREANRVLALATSRDYNRAPHPSQ